MLLLDGAMGTELIDRGVAERGGLWAAGALLDAKDVVLDVHRDYIAAGSDWITTNTYSTIPSYLDKASLGARFKELANVAGELARRAANESERQITVAGSMPPLDESYRPDLVTTTDSDRDVYRRLARVLVPHVDVLICETMSSIAEADLAVAACKEQTTEEPRRIYVSFTLTQRPLGLLRSGETVDDAIRFAYEKQVDGLMFNCSSPESVAVAIESAKRKLDIPIGAYPNRFSEVPEGWTLDNELIIDRNEELTPEVFARFGLEAKSLGASIYGGCCGIGPDHVRALRTALDESC